MTTDKPRMTADKLSLSADKTPMTADNFFLHTNKIPRMEQTTSRKSNNSKSIDQSHPLQTKITLTFTIKVYYNCTVNQKEVAVMLDRLHSLEDRYNKLNEMLSDPEIISDTNKLREYSKEQSGLEDVVLVYREYKDVLSQLKDAKEMLEDHLDDEMNAMVKAEVAELTDSKDDMEEKMKVLQIGRAHV